MENGMQDKDLFSASELGSELGVFPEILWANETTRHAGCGESGASGQNFFKLWPCISTGSAREQYCVWSAHVLMWDKKKEESKIIQVRLQFVTIMLSL